MSALNIVTVIAIILFARLGMRLLYQALENKNDKKDK
jgi:putative Mn2+ efflux pump MntP